MNVEQLKEGIEGKLGLTFDDQEVIDVFNEAMMDLAEVLRLETRAYADLTQAHETVKWPDNMFEPIMVKLDKVGIITQRNIDDTSEGYQIFGGEFHFGDTLKPPDKCTIWYYRYPEMLTVEDMDKEPDIPKRFRHALKYYFIIQYQQKDEELQLEEDYMRKYMTLKMEIDKHTRKQKGMHRTRIAKTRAWR